MIKNRYKIERENLLNIEIEEQGRKMVLGDRGQGK
jgi:hypothetical protein